MHDLRNLPDEVLSRLGDTPYGVQIREQRLAEHVRFTPEVRVDDTGVVHLSGYATVYDFPYDVAGGAPWGWSETICRGACDLSVQQRDDVRFLINHDGMPLARTKSKTLTLESDQSGLMVAATLDSRSPTVQSLMSAMSRGDLDEMSFAFKAIEQHWNDDYTERQITQVKLFDVSAVTYPANPATVVGLRNNPPAPQPGFSLSLALAEAEQYRRRAV